MASIGPSWQNLTPSGSLIWWRYLCASQLAGVSPKALRISVHLQMQHAAGRPGKSHFIQSARTKSTQYFQYDIEPFRNFVKVFVSFSLIVLWQVNFVGIRVGDASHPGPGASKSLHSEKRFHDLSLILMQSNWSRQTQWTWKLKL